MQTVKWSDLEYVQKSDVGRIAVISGNGPTLAVENTLGECVDAINDIGSPDDPITIDDIDCHTDPRYLTNEDVCAVEIGE